MEHIKALKIVLAKDFEVVKFFKILEYPSSQRDLAEEDLRQALEVVSSKNGKLSSKAQQWLRDFDVVIHSLNVERYWNSAQASEEREITQTMKAIYSEKEEQHIFRVKSNIITEHDVASDSLRTNIQERLGKRPSLPHTLDSNKKMKSSGEILTIDAVHDIPETSSSNYTDTEQETEDTSPFEVDLVKFDEAYLKLDSNRMWKLKSGRKVEEVVYEFARNLPGETCLHSFIINDSDADAKSLFSDNEWKEITASEVKENPSLEYSLRELMTKYTVKSVEELREIIYEPFIPDGNEYDQRLHNDLDFINHAYRSMLFLWQKKENPFDSLKLEGWYEMNVWSHFVYLTFHGINIDLVRGEDMSCASGDRKNLTGTINDRKKIGKKGDGIFRLCRDRLEFGAVEAGRKWEGQSGTKYLNDSLKLCKMLKDMIAQLTTICDGREDLVRKLEVIGILHGANRIQIITMDYPKGYISRIKHRKFCEVAGRLTKSNPLALVLKEILCAKSIILGTLDLINQKDDVDLENFLNDSDEQDG